MTIIIGLIAAAINIIACIKNIKTGLMLYVIFVILLPVIKIFGLTVSYEIFFFMPLLILVLVKKSRIYINGIHSLLFLYLLLTLLSTLLTVLFNSEATLMVLGVFGLIRSILLIVLLSLMFNDGHEKIETIFFVVIFVNLIVVLIQMMYPQSVKVFYDLYYKEGLTPLKTYLELGRFYRGLGTFGTPIYLGILSLIIVAFTFSKFLSSRYSLKNIIAFFCSLVCGLISLTKIFLLGMLIIVVSGILLYVLLGYYKNIKSKQLLFFLFTIIMSALALNEIVKYSRQSGFFIDYYIEYLTKPFEAFETRYDSSSGNLINTYLTFTDHPFFGVGKTIFTNEFIGDSALITILHDTGAIGIAIYILIFMKLLILQLKDKNITGVLIIITLLLTGFAAPVLTSIFGTLAIAYLSKQNSKSSKELIKKDKSVVEGDLLGKEQDKGYAFN
ncbi:hypothetical protein SD70_15785 [Gordoniibacillus kamchatkensis]|uniref:Uncharacterized protein n=1 Tax=Gordoniibacillus kamchatkensis TaxID=1590651 RepID=A0ABR5AH27_9BACL|nr:hypothetical protein [Paenibacillus sp. VKM B-2647]KIL40133.1 hypothetical protein SD70_15785 [Paenibacillus sp. VKM B-2647]